MHIAKAAQTCSQSKALPKNLKPAHMEKTNACQPVSKKLNLEMTKNENGLFLRNDNRKI